MKEHKPKIYVGKEPRSDNHIRWACGGILIGLAVMGIFWGICEEKASGKNVAEAQRILAGSYISVNDNGNSLVITTPAGSPRPEVHPDFHDWVFHGEVDERENHILTFTPPPPITSPEPITPPAEVPPGKE